MEALLCTSPAITAGRHVRSPLPARQAPTLPLPLAVVPTAAAAAASSRSTSPGLGFPGVRSRRPRARAASEDDSSMATFGQFVTAAKAGIETVKEVKPAEGDDETPSGAMEDVPTEEQPGFVNLFDQLDLKLDSEDTYFILIYGAGAFVALWISSAVVGAIDSIPLFPKVMEVIGLGFTIWFTYRYLLFKKNRDELFEKIENLKEQIIGPSVD